MILGFTIIHLLGLVDDFRNIPARYKLLGQILAAGLLVYGGAKLPGFSVFGLVIPFGPFSFVLSVFWLISLSNAVNLIDGIDGLAGGTSFISALAFALLHFLMGNRLGLLFSLSLAGALLGFLVFNKPKAKIFMGDSGSLFLGFLLGSLYFVGIPMDSPLSLGGIGVTLTILIIPVIDMVAAILRRLRKGLPIFAPDREHLHHKLLDFGFSVPQILFRIYPWVLFAGLSGVYWVYSFTLIGRISVFADLALFAVWIISAFLFGHIHFKNKKLKA